MTQTMKAIRAHGYGGPEVLSLDEVPRPACGPGDVLIEVHATAINPVDWKARRGYQRAVIRREMPAILGMDVSGVVAEVGERVEGFEVGDAVFSSPTHKRQGTYAEYVAIDAAEVAHKPESVSHVEAASVPLVGLTAWDCLVEAANLEEGQTVFIEAGSGGVGSIAIQIARTIGATISTTCSPRNEELVRSLGADRVVNYREEHFDEVLPPQDVVLECMGPDSRPRALRLAKKGGVVTTINSNMPSNVERLGPWLGIAATGLYIVGYAIGGRLRHGVRVKSVVRDASGENLAALARWIDEGRIKPVVDRTYPLAELAEAHRYSESGRARGKIVIDLEG